MANTNTPAIIASAGGIFHALIAPAARPVVSPADAAWRAEVSEVAVIEVGGV
ncbi:MAG: hypothetical protein AAGK09_14920 [Planctomycetota bacterium]